MTNHSKCCNLCVESGMILQAIHKLIGYEERELSELEMSYPEVCAIMDILQENKEFREEEQNLRLRCECGADKANTTQHSNWCPKH